jgi:hypothetical protein
MKDIFIDNNIASRFTNPLDPEYKKLIKWLMEYDEDKPEQNAYLVVSNKLLKEYYASAQHASTATSIPVIIDALTRQGRKITITNEEIKTFKQKHFTKKNEKKMRCNNEDREHMPVVFLSTRKYALAIDDAFVYDLTHFPSFTARVEKRPEDLPYK